MWCPECDMKMTKEDVVLGDEVVGGLWVCPCGKELEDDMECDCDEFD